MLFNDYYFNKSLQTNINFVSVIKDYQIYELSNYLLFLLKSSVKVHGSEINVGWAFSPTALNHSGWK